MTEPALSPLARRLLEKHLEADATGSGSRGSRRTVPGHAPDEHAEAYAELVRAGYLRLGTVAFSGGAPVQSYDLTAAAPVTRPGPRHFPTRRAPAPAPPAAPRPSSPGNGAAPDARARAVRPAPRVRGRSSGGRWGG